MDKNAIKKYAVWAREELIKRVFTKAEEYGINQSNIVAVKLDVIGERVLTKHEQRQRIQLVDKIQKKWFELAKSQNLQKEYFYNDTVYFSSDDKISEKDKKKIIELVAKIKKDSFEHVMEEAAYTWFNRFIALRFMEVNGFLPSKVRVFTDDENNFKPKILDEAIYMDLEGLNLEKVLDLKEQNKNNELYKYLIITQCNALHSVLPKMFPEIDDYTQLLFPDNILREGSAVEQMITIIPEEDWKDAVQIIGWLYQYYNTEPKADVFAGLKKNIKISKENIPAATQLFTPDWIARYMVENSLGRIAVDKFGVDPIAMDWKYFLEESEQTEEVQNQLKIINSEKLTLEELKVIDPCMGSGHILVYAFDLLMQIYEGQGYTSRDAVANIIENNIYGLDIDERAYQLSYFALMMKARSYDRRFFSKNIEPQIYCPKGYEDGEEYGSLLNVDELEEKPELPEVLTLFDLDYDIQLNTWNFRRLLNQKYDVVVTNPPYMGSKGMSAKLSKYVQDHYADSKSDLFSAFIERGNDMTVKNGFNCMVTMQSWMFLSSFEKMRDKIIRTKAISNLMHMENMVMGIAFGTAVAVFKNSNIKGFKGTYNHITMKDMGENDEPITFPVMTNRFAQVSTENFSKIPGSPIAYWVSEKMMSAFENGENLGDIAYPKTGMTTGDNNRFLRFWSEIELHKANFSAKNAIEAKKSLAKWFPYCKGGGFKRWYGFNEYLVNWENDGFEIKNNIKDNGLKAASVRSETLYFKELITWSAVTSGKFSCRIVEGGYLFDSGGSSISVNLDKLYLLALLNSTVGQYCLNISNATINYQPGDIAGIPVIKKEQEQVETLVEQNISLSKTDWDSFETSWDFSKHPLISYAAFSPKQIVEEIKNGFNIMDTMEDAFKNWEYHCKKQFDLLKSNEEELNRIFIDIYGLQDELTPEVEDKDVTVRLADKTRDVKSFISYAVGCMFGRYSLDVDGLAFAGGDFDSSKYKIFIPDADNVLPICDDEYFEDDIVGRFVDFVKIVYGADTLEENLLFIANAIGTKGTAREVIRNYFLNGFYADHCKTYQKRPIYWQIDSGKKNGFKALVYMHRYSNDLFARVRTDYVHEQQGRYRTAITNLERRIIDVSTSERLKLTKQLTAFKDQETEIRIFEEKIHHLADQMIRIDLDDGVKNNYAIFGDVLTKIK